MVTTTLLEAIMPDHDVRERQETWIPSPPAAVEDSWRAISPNSIRLLPFFFGKSSLPAWLLGRRDAELDPDQPLVQQMLDAGYTMLAQEPEREVVIGAINRFWDPVDIDPKTYAGRSAFMTFNEPRFNKVAVSFRFTPRHGGTLVTTETRVLSTDPPARRRFYAFWLLIRPASALIRRSWLWALGQDAPRRQASYGMASGD